MSVRASQRCAHCGLDAGRSPQRDGDRVFCCAGCLAVYRLLHDEGLGRFYDAGGVGSVQFRAAGGGAGGRPARRPPPAVPDAIEEAGAAELDVAGMRCASCAWLIEHYLGRRPGVETVQVSYVGESCRVQWDRARTSLSQLLAALERIGYRARPAQAALRLRQGDRDARALLVRAGVSALLSMNVMLAAVALYAGEFQGMGSAARDLLRVLSALLAGPVVVYGGWPFLSGAAGALRAGRATMDTLIALGATTAYGASLYGLATGGPVFFDTAAMIVTLILAGRLVEHAARRRGGHAIRGLLALLPDVARLVTPDGPATVEAAALAEGQVVEVRAGERLPADGVVIDGSSSLDVSLLTGEAAPRDVAPGDEVAAGSINDWGVLRIRATRVGDEAAVPRIIAAVRRATEARAPAQRLADRVMGWFVPSVLLAAVAAGLCWWAGGAAPARALLVGISVVVIACPCALGLATPAALAIAVGEAARRGIFFRGADVLERAADVRQVVFDKTGTLTDGRFGSITVHPAPDWRELEVLRVAAAAEAQSGHALARAICREADARGVGAAPPQAATGTTTAGAGVEAPVDGRRVHVGSAAFLVSRGVAVPHTTRDAAGASLVHVAVHGRYAGAIAAADRIRPEATAAVERLAAQGIGTVLLSGDRQEAVRWAADEAGISRSRARFGLAPEEKAEAVAQLRGAGGSVAMVGDGINDAPALAAADVGFAVGTGTDVALESADVALAGSDLTQVPVALALARRARRVVRQNLGWALGYNLVAIPIAAAGLLHPILAAGAMALSSVSVLLNSLRLRGA